MTAELVSAGMIWDAAPHCAFTDLAYFGGAWFCAFREAESHALSRGKIRVLKSRDGEKWESAALIGEEGVDLRDPHFSREPGGELELMIGGTRLVDGAYVGRRPRVSRSADGERWTDPVPVLEEGDWLWRATRPDEGTGVGGEAAADRDPAEDADIAYGITYRLPRRRRWTTHLMASGDGYEYREIAALAGRGLPNEATIRFDPDRKAVILLRREAGAARALIGESEPPYRRWKWRRTKERVGGPNFLILPNGDRWAACRFIAGGKARTAIARMDGRNLEPVLDLPSGGDCGYPGMVYREGTLWVSYYSSHEKQKGADGNGGKPQARIYIAKIKLG